MLNEGGGWNDAICDHALKELPLLGVCLGMQLLGKASAEGNGAGLSLLDFKVQPLGGTGANTNVGWRKVTDIMGPDSEIFKRSYFYFTHSYCVPRADASFEWLVSGDEVEFVAGVRSGNIWGLQFHPERSSHAGQELLQRFAKI